MFRMTESRERLGNFSEKRVIAYFRIVQPNGLTRLQSDLAANHKLQLVDRESLHLTFIHFGKPRELYDKTAKHENVEPKVFQKKLDTFLSVIQEGRIRERAQVMAVSTLGPTNNPAVVAELDLPEVLLIARDCYLDWLFDEICPETHRRDLEGDLLKNSGVNWGFEGHYRPHVTIAQGIQPLKLPTSRPASPIDITLEGIYVVK